MTYTPRYASERSDRIDTTITEVAIRGGDTSQQSAAVRYVHHMFPDERPNVLGVWRTHERDHRGYPVFAVEWEAMNDEQ
jgi:hypothetical protein